MSNGSSSSTQTDWKSLIVPPLALLGCLLPGLGLTAIFLGCGVPYWWGAVLLLVPGLGLYWKLHRRFPWFASALRDHAPRLLWGLIPALALAVLGGVFAHFGLKTASLVSPSPRTALPTKTLVLLGPQADHHWRSFANGFASYFASDCGTLGLQATCTATDGAVTGDIYLPLNTSQERQHFKIEYVDSTDNQFTKKKMEELARRTDVLMVLGLVTSTQATDAIDVLQEAALEPQQWPTIILPMATASHLVKAFNPKGNRPVLRIVPSNELQADEIALYLRMVAGAKKNCRVAIFRDAVNGVYSNDLAPLIRSRVESKGLSVVFDGAIGPNGPGAYVTDSVAMLRPDYVVFLGMLDVAVPLIRQVRIFATEVTPSPTTTADGSHDSRESAGWTPAVLVSDGTVNPIVTQYSGRHELVPLVGFFPHGEPRKHWLERHTEAPGNGVAPSFVYFGHDAAAVVVQLLRQTKLATREDLAAAVQSFKSQYSQDRALEPPQPLDRVTVVGPYRFDQYGDVKGMRYHTWILTNEGWSHKEMSELEASPP